MDSWVMCGEFRVTAVCTIVVLIIVLATSNACALQHLQH